MGLVGKPLLFASYNTFNVIKRFDIENKVPKKTEPS